MLWEALKHYQDRLEQRSASSPNEDQQLAYDEKLQDMEGLLRSIKSAAQNDYQLKLD